MLLCVCLCSCAENSPSLEEMKIEESFSEYPNNFINWDEILSQQSKIYFVYVFSYDCYYCRQIKNRIISFSNSSEYSVYFVEYSKQIPIKNNLSITIGAKDIDNVFIKGTPSLLLIDDATVAINVGGKNEVCEILQLYEN